MGYDEKGLGQPRAEATGHSDSCQTLTSAWERRARVSTTRGKAPSTVRKMGRHAAGGRVPVGAGTGVAGGGGAREHGALPGVGSGAEGGGVPARRRGAPSDEGAVLAGGRGRARVGMGPGGGCGGEAGAVGGGDALEGVVGAGGSLLHESVRGGRGRARGNGGPAAVPRLERLAGTLVREREVPCRATQGPSRCDWVHMAGPEGEEEIAMPGSCGGGPETMAVCSPGPPSRCDVRGAAGLPRCDGYRGKTQKGHIKPVRGSPFERPACC